jgi:hypothetical protein
MLAKRLEDVERISLDFLMETLPFAPRPLEGFKPGDIFWDPLEGEYFKVFEEVPDEPGVFEIFSHENINDTMDSTGGNGPWITKDILPRIASGEVKRIAI